MNRIERLQWPSGGGRRSVVKEVPGRVLTDDLRVASVAAGRDWRRAVRTCMEELDALETLCSGKRVGIKINLGGGIVGCPATFTDPALVEALVEVLREQGVECFLCEGGMRGQAPNERMLANREIPPILERTGVPFVDLSRCPRVPVEARGVDCRLEFPDLLLDPETRIVSLTLPKGHWECGVSLTQKNLYGALADGRKSIYHRKYGRIDRVVAAAGRILAPDLSLLGGRWWGAGLGPHFCVPIRMDTLLASRDVVRLDAFVSDLLGYPPEKVAHIRLNCLGEVPEARLTPGSRVPNPRGIQRMRRHGLRPWERRVWKALIYPQYFLPHGLQPILYPGSERVASWVNRWVYHPRGDRLLA